MKSLALLVFIGLITVGILACGGETAESTATPPPAEPTTQPTAEPTVAPPPTDAPEPTVPPTDAPEPTAAPEPTEPPAAPTAEPTEAPEPTEVPEPTVAPTDTPTPEPTALPTNTPEPTPEPTEEPELPIAVDLAPLGDNLLFVAYLVRETQTWQVYDATGNFKPEDIPLPPRMEIPDASDISALTELMPDEVYSIIVKEQQDVEFANFSRTLYKGRNDVAWR